MEVWLGFELWGAGRFGAGSAPVLSLPDGLSAVRIPCVPVVLALAWTGATSGFVGLFALALATDVLDGARQDVHLSLLVRSPGDLDFHGPGAGAEAHEVCLRLPVEPLREEVHGHASEVGPSARRALREAS